MIHRHLTSLLLGLGLLQSCAAFSVARMAMPEGLPRSSDQIERLELHGLGHGERGTAQIDARELRFERSATRLEVGDAAYVADQHALSFTLHGEGVRQGSCRLRRRELKLGLLSLPVKPLALQCQLEAASMEVRDDNRLGTLQQTRRGELRVQQRSLGVRSVHAVEGSPLPVADAIGYVLEDGGRPVAALELNGEVPVLWLPRGDAALREASLQALLALALMWQPD